jgi:hypothetical protein
MVPRDRSSRLVETRRYPIVVAGSVYIVLDVLLAAPAHLDGTVDLLGNFDRDESTSLEILVRSDDDRSISSGDVRRCGS